MSNKPTYIVTGATGGIGREIVKEIASRGNARIVLAVRNTRAAGELAESLSSSGCEITAMKLDLCSLESVQAMAAEFLAKGWKIKALVNNAGIMPGEIRITDDGHESATQVNYIGTRLLTELLLPAVEEGGTIVFTTSLTRHIARCRFDWDEHAKTFHGLARRFITYGRSKRMIAAFAAKLSQKLAHRNIRVNCADPGIVDTNMVTMGNGVIDFLSAKLFRPIISTPAQGAEPAIRALYADESGYIFTRKKKSKNNITF